MIVIESKQVDAAKLEFGADPFEVQVNGPVLDPGFLPEASVALYLARLHTHVARIKIERWAYKLTNEAREDEHDQTSQCNHTGKTCYRKAGRPHDDDFTVAGNRAEAQQRSNQCRDRQHFKCQIWQTQCDVKDDLRRLEVALGVIEFPNKLEEPGERQQHDEDQDSGQDDRAHQVLTENAGHRRIRRCQPF